jgi:hypothetical protein
MVKGRISRFCIFFNFQSKKNAFRDRSTIKYTGKAFAEILKLQSS